MVVSDLAIAHVRSDSFPILRTTAMIHCNEMQAINLMKYGTIQAASLARISLRSQNPHFVEMTSEHSALFRRTVGHWLYNCIDTYMKEVHLDWRVKRGVHAVKDNLEPKNVYVQMKDKIQQVYMDERLVLDWITYAKGAVKTNIEQFENKLTQFEQLSNEWTNRTAPKCIVDESDPFSTPLPLGDIMLEDALDNLSDAFKSPTKSSGQQTPSPLKPKRVDFTSATKEQEDDTEAVEYPKSPPPLKRQKIVAMLSPRQSIVDEFQEHVKASESSVHTRVKELQAELNRLKAQK